MSEDGTRFSQEVPVKPARTDTGTEHKPVFHLYFYNGKGFVSGRAAHLLNSKETAAKPGSRESVCELLKNTSASKLIGEIPADRKRGKGEP